MVTPTICAPHYGSACGICFEDVEGTDTAGSIEPPTGITADGQHVQLACRHVFHRHCATGQDEHPGFLGYTSACPLCRQAISPATREQIERQFGIVPGPSGTPEEDAELDAALFEAGGPLERLSTTAAALALTLARPRSRRRRRHWSASPLPQPKPCRPRDQQLLVRPVPPRTGWSLRPRCQAFFLTGSHPGALFQHPAAPLFDGVQQLPLAAHPAVCTATPGAQAHRLLTARRSL